MSQCNYITIFIGNGLGMAIDPSKFTIEAGLKGAWKALDEDMKQRVMSLLTGQSELNNEEQIDKHYEVIQTCLSLGRLEEANNLLWLDERARDFPNKFNAFIKNAGWHFFEQPSDNEHLINFINNLRGFILDERNKTHLITLNYDKLLYDYLCVDTEIMDGYKGKLVDGFLVGSTGFNPSNLENYHNKFGWYLHLHGSPLFYTDAKTGVIDKSKFKNIYFEDDPNFIREHLILCKTTLKPTLISRSPLLYWYWDYFKRALKQSSKIILIGYSGNDSHINTEIISANSDLSKSIVIVEYQDPHINRSDRILYWEGRLNLPKGYFTKENFRQFKSILNFKFDISDDR